ncbi:hypothetical protein B0T20DRAFT_154139 [Sordaria brevicollis]|uniref:Uncharacterized protein n=1 Tax=Sordaria brevicollis TaxID=83679 RepID=A0AAE0PJ58_SORBR|nr:hypothetical protein B0T20DRAFT_154139 [Sordaria brevicollis]
MRDVMAMSRAWELEVLYVPWIVVLGLGFLSSGVASSCMVHPLGSFPGALTSWKRSSMPGSTYWGSGHLGDLKEASRGQERCMFPLRLHATDPLECSMVSIEPTASFAF